MKKILLTTALLAAGISQVQAAPYNVYFYDGSPDSSAVTITFSGDCSGKITDTVSSVWANASDDPDNNTSDAGANISGISGMYMSNYFYAQSPGSTTSISNKKGVLNIALKDSTTYGLSEYVSRIHATGADAVVTCKNGQTLQVLLNDIGWSMGLVWDKSLTNNASFTLKGKASPFDYKYAQTTSGYVYLPAVCKNEGLFTSTGNIATDTFQSSCKMQKVKLKVSVKASGKIYYN